MNRVINSWVRIAAVPIFIGAAVFLLGQLPISVASLLAQTAGASGQTAGAPLRFVILGDRTGETVPGIYEAVWREIAAAKPAFVVGVGDSIQGLDDGAAEREWLDFAHVLEPFHSIPLFPAPGNHDVWSDASAKFFAIHAGHPLHYSFDEGGVHVTVLDNSRSDAMPAEEMTFLDQDLKAHEAQPVKFIVSHRPSWLLNVILKNPEFPIQQLAEKYGVHYVVAGHVHEMMHGALNGVEYISVPSAGGHLRASGQYEDGWFFGYTVVTVSGADVKFEVRELQAPNGAGRVTPLAAWGAVGLAKN